MGRLGIFSVVCMFGFVLTNSLQGASVKLTTEGLGLGNTNLNREKTVDPDKDGFKTSLVTGEGSILWIQEDGMAGLGTSSPLLVEVTAETRLDFSSAGPNDAQAGVIFIADESSKTPDGVKEGLGVRAFTVDENGDRVIDTDGIIKHGETIPPTNRAKIEGSKHVSGGTGPTVFDANNPNGSPHVDEKVNFDFKRSVAADSFELLLSDIKPDAKNGGIEVDLHIELVSGTIIETIRSADGVPFFLPAGATAEDRLVGINFGMISGIGPNDILRSFYIRALHPTQVDPLKETAEHFFITGFNWEPGTPAGGAVIVPLPAAAWMALPLFGGLGVTQILRRRRFAA